MTAAQAFAEILEKEHDAARRADVGALVEIQDAKRKAMEDLRQESLPPEVLDAIATRARQNIAMIRHLVQCMRGLASIGAGDTYTPGGRLSSGILGHSRGLL